MYPTHCRRRNYGLAPDVDRVEYTSMWQMVLEANLPSRPGPEACRSTGLYAYRLYFATQSSKDTETYTRKR